MALLLTGDLVWLHVPKTGGNWVRQLLEDHGCVREEIEHKHAPYDVIAGWLRKEAADRKKMRFFGTVRNPLTWYESYYKYQAWRKFRTWGEAGDPYVRHPWTPLNKIRDKDFNDFVMHVHRRCPGYLTGLYAGYFAQSNSVVMRTESLREDFASINARFGLGIPEAAIRDQSRINVSPSRRIVWRRDVLERTVELERAAFEAYGYGWDDVVDVAPC